MTDTTASEAFRIDVHEAEALIAEHMPRYAAKWIPLAAAAGQILRQSIVAERDQPPFDRATMDGIAVAAAGLSKPQLQVAGIQAAGQAVSTLPGPEHCIETMTGAVVPVGADTIIPVERIAINNGIASIEAAYTATPGQFIHRQGSDHRQGDLLLQPGCRIGPAEMAVLTAAGAADVEVAEWPAIAVVSTGDELVDVGAAIEDFQIRSSNDRAIESALQLHGCDRVTRAHLRDDPAALLEQIRMLHADNDVLILSGGVSMGKYDYVPGILKELGVELVFHKILQRPGLPMWFGVSGEGKPVFALPGNPVSTLVCLVRYVRPALEQAMGLTPAAPETVSLSEAIDFNPDLCWFLPVVAGTDARGMLRAEPHPTNTSGDFIGLRNTSGVIELPRGSDHFPAGYAARLYRW